MSEDRSTSSDRSKARLHMAALAAAGIVSALSLFGQGVAATQEQAPPAGPCIAIVVPSVQGIEGNAAEIGSSVRDLFVTYLSGPSIRVIQLQSRLASQAIAEAKQQSCDQVLTATLTRKRGGGTLGKVMGQAAGTASWSIPGGGTTTSAIARGAAVGVAQAVSGLASTTHAKDELQLEYRVSSAAGAAKVGPKTEKMKATVDGEDLLTPLVGKASETIATALVK